MSGPTLPSEEQKVAGTDLGMDSAYPITPPLDDGGQVAAGYPYPESGLTKREVFAKAAMQGILASNGWFEQHIHVAARLAVEYADALLKELAK